MANFLSDVTQYKFWVIICANVSQQPRQRPQLPADGAPSDDLIDLIDKWPRGSGPANKNLRSTF